ncbi:ABC transporter permease [Paenibacillus harenae]|uniref:C1q domain-containing protein n=1 Tax=Paenibacillus harenae TaxID=306543 RepID=A0ABT9U9E3_PAEHA|nr:ABC transporter permease [Paenibacillus harenae]MDQ0116255.1 hypothetical protein [Paenibacillus harenae]
MIKKMVNKRVVKKRSVTFTKSKSISTGIATKCKPKKWPAPKKSFKCKGRKRVIRKTELSRASAFRALASTPQSATPGQDIQVRYQNEVLDVNNEYNPLTSTFRPQRSGVYSLVATVAFFSETPPLNVFLTIRVNGIDQISDFEVFSSFAGLIDASGIIPLNAGDTVRVFVSFSGEGEGNIVIAQRTLTRFEGARIR